MKSIKEFKEGLEATHKDLGKVVMTSRVDGSRTLVNVRCIQRGKGWDESRQQYRRVTTMKNGTVTRTLTRRDEYGHEDTVHIKELEL